MKMRAPLLLALVVVSPLWAVDEPADFTTDGCSLFPDGSPVERNLWCDCCVAHDIAYWRGGTEEERKVADEALRMCVEQRTNKPFAELVHAGVRAGGLPIIPTWYRWGYGWKYGRGYQALTAEEEALTEAALKTYRQEHGTFSCDATPVDKVSGNSAAPVDGTPVPGLPDF